MTNLIHGDSLEVLHEISSNSIDLILTDCPYKVVQGGRTGEKTPRGGIFSTHHEGFKSGKVFSENSIDFIDWLPIVFEKLKNKSHCYIMINGRNLKDLQLAAEKSGFSYQNLLVWDKGNLTPNRYYMQGVEFILMLTKNGSRSINNMGTSNIFRNKNEVGKKDHPSMKPVSLMEILILNSTNENDTVLDPFMGTGSTGVACCYSNRNFIGIEKDFNYFSIAKNKIFKMKGILNESEH
jgi:site-specific DNA-methyltransferase (adenine-specific)